MVYKLTSSFKEKLNEVIEEKEKRFLLDLLTKNVSADDLVKELFVFIKMIESSKTDHELANSTKRVINGLGEFVLPKIRVELANYIFNSGEVFLDSE